ncbi:MAG TPA: serine/threonine-protein kinase [Gemmataceae bacterium]|nr:serine/threonine-protein kinase [Gemmataceae bacterium]
MLAGKTIGPFTIDKEIGAGAMGSVYRAKHNESGKWVAIKIVATGLAANEVVKQRFEREFEILKQLKHPNIVRLYAAGNFSGTPFYAMEYVEGESLDKVMARRGRISWEEVVQLGRQLCAALQHAHDKGIVHRDLKPSNIMILKDATVKLTDFGIAKDLDRTAITEANCTVGTAAYMSPEQCKGERNMTSRSDLYSMGVMFYELITGKKPFEADSAMEMFMQHVKGKFERPSRLVLDVPVFLDTLVCQLMEKDPERRPYNAAMVADALGRVEEKVAAQQAAGLDAARTRNKDKPPEAAMVDADDKEAVRALLGKKKKKRRSEGLAFYQRIWFKAAILGIVLLGVIGGLLAFLLVPPSPDALFKSIEQLMATGDLERKAAARQNGAISKYLTLFGGQDDEPTRNVRKWADDIDADEYERRLLKRIDFKIPLDEDETQCRRAMDAEDSGELSAARETWAKLAKYKDGPPRPTPSDKRSCGLFALAHLAILDGVDKREKNLQKVVTKNGLTAGFEPADDIEKKAAHAMLVQLQDPPKAVKAWEEFQKNLDRDLPAHRAWWLLAAKRSRELKETTKTEK